jgi:hypothetical protein
MARKAAIVIGVDKPGGLTPLESAARGAEEVATWLQGEGFTVECITDKDEPVTTDKIKKATKKLNTKPARYHMLLVYFSGHGLWQRQTDIWLLSNAPVEPDEAINVRSSMDLLKYSGIPNIVIISDACRSLADDRAGAMISGRDVFMNYQDITDPSIIDVFKASTESRSAYEGKLGGTPHSVLTYALMSAFREPEPDLIREITEGGQTIKVVPNRKLKNYLQPKVNELLDIVASESDNPGAVLKQRIEINVPSDDVIYISRILGHVDTTRVSVMALPTAALSDDKVAVDAADAIERDLSTMGIAATGLDTLSVSVADTEAELSMRMPQGDVDHFETETGLLVHGAVLVDFKVVSQDSNSWAEILAHGNGVDQPGIIRVYPGSPAQSVLVKLEDGRSAVLASLFGYIGHARFDQTGLANVSYTPSTNNERWQWYEHKKDKVNRLRALVSVAVQHNAFHIESDRDAQALADRIRVEKSIDPTLGLYAAHAYNLASQDSRIGSVLQYMYYDLNADLFDVWVLASRIKNKPQTTDLVIPFCPMLTQTWNLLGPRGIQLPAVLREAEAYLCNSLWTTFKPEATDKIIQAIETGELT